MPKPSEARFIAVDLGASSGRVLLGSWDGTSFGLQELHRFGNGAVAVQDELYWNTLGLWNEIRTGLLRYGAEHKAAPAGIGVDTWGVDFALLDKSGRMLGNPRHYRDPRTNGMPERVFAKLSRQELYRRTGIQFMQINTIFQLCSMVETQDPQLEAAHTLLMTPDLFHYWLSGEKTCEYTIASTSGLLGAKARDWDRELIEQLGIPNDLLLPVVTPGTILGQVQPGVMRQTQLRESPSVIASGGHDTACAVAAIPGLDRRSAFISSGTWSLMGAEVADPILSEQALAFDFTNEGGVEGSIRLLKNVAGLWLLQECRRTWQREGHDYSWDELTALASAARPFHSFIDPDASDFLHPDDMPAAIRAYCERRGLPAPETVGEVVRCCLESLALKYRWVLERLETLVGHRLEVIRVVGGGCQNALLCRFTANACAKPVIAGPVEATALGNILMQAIALGFLPNLEAAREAVMASVEQAHYEPQEEARWQEAWERFKGLVSKGA